MDLLLFRHGLAEDRDEFKKKNLDDRLRPLTLKGRKRTQKMAIHLRTEYPSVDLLVTSPLTRARQTAEIISQIYFDSVVTEAPDLAPDAPVPTFLKWIKSHGKEAKRVVAVGHEPHLSRFASWCLTGQEESILQLKKSGVAGLYIPSPAKFEAGTAKLLWLLQPGLIE